MTHKSKRLNESWWCELHQEIHLGDILKDFSMGHRKWLHPVFAHLSSDRYILDEMPDVTGFDIQMARGLKGLPETEIAEGRLGE